MNDIDRYKIAIERVLNLCECTDKIDWYIGPSRSIPGHTKVRVIVYKDLEFGLQIESGKDTLEEDSNIDLLFRELLVGVCRYVIDERIRHLVKVNKVP